MGRDKVLLPFGGSTMLETVLSKLRQANVERTVVVLRPDLPDADLRARRAGAEVVMNPHPEGEMLVSIRLGIETLASSVEAFFVWPADHPAVRPETLRDLAARASRDLAIIPVYAGGRGHPALLGAGLVSEIAQISPDEGLRQLWRKRVDAVRELSVEDPGILANLDDPEAYARAVRREEESRRERARRVDSGKTE
jgi:CTP:molybdopterin cytidylyltransferase MocA